MQFDPVLDHPFEGDLPTPDFAEAQMWNFSDGKYGVMYHVGTMLGDLDLWHNAFSINCPDGTVLATKVVGRGQPGIFGTPKVHSATIDPYRAWRIHFDGGMVRYKPEDLWKGPGGDGAHVPVRVELEISAAHGPWEPGAGSESHSIFQTFCKMHHEQPLKVKGRIQIDGEMIEYDAIGHRDHSFGPRQFGKLQRGAWFNGTLESGWSFLTFLGEDASGVFEKSAIFENGNIILGSMEQSAGLSTTAPEPRRFEFKLRLEDGRERTITMNCTEGVNWFCPGFSEWCLGANLTNPRNYNWAMCFAEVECGGEKGLGFADRGAAAELLKYA